MVNEPDSSVAATLLGVWANNALKLIAPPLFSYEMANILYQRIKRGDLGVEQAKLSFYKVFASGILLDEELDDSLAIRAIELAHQFHLRAAYDAQYLALAEREGCEFWTADQRLWNAVRSQLAWVHWLGAFQPPPDAP